MALTDSKPERTEQDAGSIPATSTMLDELADYEQMFQEAVDARSYTDAYYWSDIVQQRRKELKELGVL